MCGVRCVGLCMCGCFAFFPISSSCTGHISSIESTAVTIIVLLPLGVGVAFFLAHDVWGERKDEPFPVYMFFGFVVVVGAHGHQVSLQAHLRVVGMLRLTA